MESRKEDEKQDQEDSNWRHFFTVLDRKVDDPSNEEGGLSRQEIIAAVQNMGLPLNIAHTLLRDLRDQREISSGDFIARAKELIHSSQSERDPMTLRACLRDLLTLDAGLKEPSTSDPSTPEYSNSDFKVQVSERERESNLVKLRTSGQNAATSTPVPTASPVSIPPSTTIIPDSNENVVSSTHADDINYEKLIQMLTEMSQTKSRGSLRTSGHHFRSGSTEASATGRSKSAVTLNQLDLEDTPSTENSFWSFLCCCSKDSQGRGRNATSTHTPDSSERDPLTVGEPLDRKLELPIVRSCFVDYYGKNHGGLVSIDELVDFLVRQQNPNAVQE